MEGNARVPDRKSNSPPSRRRRETVEEVTGDADSNPKPEAKKNNFEFLTFTDIQQTTDARTKRKVRSHVMHRVHQTVRSGKRELNEGVIVLDTSLLSGGEPQDTALVTRPSTLGAGRLNPFANYPIPMNMRTRHLFDHLHGPFCPMFKTMSKIGFFQTMTDPAGFRQVLCTSALHIEVLRSSGSQPNDALVMSSQALQSVHKRLANPAVRTSDGMIAAVLAFCCHSIMFRDRPAAVIHFNGLDEIVQLRGGLKSLEPSPVLRLMLFWCDTNVAFTEDHSPRYPLPAGLLAPYMSEPVASVPIPMPLAEACTSASLASAMRDLYIQNQLLVTEVLPREGFNDGVFANLNLMPLLYKLVSIRYDHLGQDPAFIKHAAYRAAAILYIAAIRVEFRIDFDASLHVQNLKDALTAMEALDFDCDIPIKVWLLVVGGTRSICCPEQHDFFVSKLADGIVQEGYQVWGQVMGYVRRVLWADGVAQGACETLRQEVAGQVWQSHGRVFQ